MVIAFKYNIQVKEVPNTGKTWLLYENAEQGPNDNPTYTDHIETEKGVPVWTNEKAYGLGFCMMCEGVITRKVHKGTGRPYILIKKEES